MNLFSEIRTLVTEALGEMEGGLLPVGLDLSAVAVEPPRDPAHGDMATNAAMVLAKRAGRKPRDIAAPLAERLADDPRVTETTVAGPGFINLRLAPSAWHGMLASVLAEGPAFGRSKLGEGQSVNVEYVSANPTGPLHVAHARGAVFGDALARLLAFAGFDVTKEYYINDGGGQIDTLARSAYLRYAEANGRPIEIPTGLYPGDYLVPVGEVLKTRYGESLLDASEETWLPEIRPLATELMMDQIRDDLAVIGVRMDVFFSERSLYGTGRIEAALADLDAKGLLYTGVLEPPKGKLPEDWEERPQTLFKATEFGDDVDRPIKKSDGAWTYFAPDIAYHYDKVQRGFDRLINVFGADHGGYVKRLKAATAALSGGEVPLDIKLIQIVKLFKDGVPFKMSKRAGTFVTLRDLVDEVGPDVVRFVMLTRKNDAALDFDFAKVLEQSRENPVWYVQYAHARVHSVLRRADEGAEAFEDGPADLALLADVTELALIAKLAEFPRLVEAAAQAEEPHRIAFYLYDLASEFHTHWNRGQERPDLRMLREDAPELTRARLALARAVGVVLSAGLGILGVTPLTEMK